MNWNLLDPISYFLFTCVLYFLSILSKRLGKVLGLKKYYYIYYAGMFFTLISSFSELIFQGTGSVHLYESVFFAVGITLGLIASIKYWAWLIKEFIKG